MYISRIYFMIIKNSICDIMNLLNLWYHNQFLIAWTQISDMYVSRIRIHHMYISKIWIHDIKN